MKKFKGRREGPVRIADQISVVINNAALGTAGVSFPPGAFSTPPIVTISACNSGYTVTTSNVPTTSGFTAVVRNRTDAITTRTVEAQFMASTPSPAGSAWGGEA